MLTQILLFLINAVCSLFAMALLARFAMQWARAPFRNPVGHFVIAFTDWMVRPARKVIPTAFGLDLPSLFLAWLILAIYIALEYALTLAFGRGLGALGLISLLAVLETLRLACNLALGVLLVSVILSWVNPHAPLAPVFNALAEPLLKPFRKLIPAVGGVDLSPLIPFLLLQVALMILAGLRFQFHL